MKKTLLLMAATIAIYAGPILGTDGIRTDANDPRIGQSVFVVPLTEWAVYANDNPPPSYGDFDHNDGWARILFSSNGSGTATWIGSNSSLTNMFLVFGKELSEKHPMVNFGAGAALGIPLDMQFKTGNGATYSFGSRNIMTEQLRGHIPEPATMGLVGLALCGIGWIKWSNKNN